MSDERRIWLIGGTAESATLAWEIAASQLPCIISVTTDSAKSLYPATPNLRVWVGQLDGDRIKPFLQQENIAAILDASHPYAVAVSQMAMAAARSHNLPYLRYERPVVKPDGETFRFPSFESLLATDVLAGERVLLTVGYRTLQHFKPWQNRTTLWARILPSLTALEAALAAGFTSDRLMALRPPISPELEKALWQQWQISMVVTKASGTAGGEAIKQQVAAELGVKLAVIDRPSLVYPRQTSDVAEAVQFCHQVLAPFSAHRDTPWRD